MTIALIPARGGSKRIPRKNVRTFCGRPIICWSIETARTSGCFERIVVSTDDDEIAAVAVEAGAEAPFRRPDALAGDHIATLPVVAHAVQWLRDHGAKPRELCCIYPTAPLLEAEDVRQGLRLLHEAAADYVFSCARFEFPVHRALRRGADGRVEPMFPEYITSRSQDLPEVFHDVGQFYWGTAEAFLAQRPIFARSSVPLIVPRARVQDIDTEDDWTRAEALFRILRGQV